MGNEKPQWSYGREGAEQAHSEATLDLLGNAEPLQSCDPRNHRSMNHVARHSA